MRKKIDDVKFFFLFFAYCKRETLHKQISNITFHTCMLMSMVWIFEMPMILFVLIYPDKSDLVIMLERSWRSMEYHLA